MRRFLIATLLLFATFLVAAPAPARAQDAAPGCACRCDFNDGSSDDIPLSVADDAACSSACTNLAAERALRVTVFACQPLSAELCGCTCTYSNGHVDAPGRPALNAAECRSYCDDNRPGDPADPARPTVETAECVVYAPAAAEGRPPEAKDGKAIGPAGYKGGNVILDLSTATSSPLGTLSVPEFLGRVVNVLMGIIGSVALLMFVYGGFVWVTSHGSPEMITKGRNILTWAALGLVLIFGAYALVNFVLTRLVGVL